MKRRAFTLPPANLPPYLQAFLVAMESGAVVLARVLGDGRIDGQEKARAAALEACPGGAIWDSAAYPVGPEERAKGPGVDVLKRAPRKARKARKAPSPEALARSSADLARAVGPELPAGYWGAAQ